MFDRFRPKADLRTQLGPMAKSAIVRPELKSGTVHVTFGSCRNWKPSEWARRADFLGIHVAPVATIGKKSTRYPKSGRTVPNDGSGNVDWRAWTLSSD